MKFQANYVTCYTPKVVSCVFYNRFSFEIEDQPNLVLLDMRQLPRVFIMIARVDINMVILGQL